MHEDRQFKEVREGHFGLILTGNPEQFPVKFPRLEGDPPLYLFVSRRKDGRWDMYGGRRDPTDITGQAGLWREVMEETNAAISFAVLGSVGQPLYIEVESHHDYAFPYACVHTGGEPDVPSSDGEKIDYARVTYLHMPPVSSTMEDVHGDLRHVTDFKFVKGSKPDRLGRTEEMVRLGLTLTTVPALYFHREEWSEKRECLPHELRTLSALPASEHVHVMGDYGHGYLAMANSTHYTIWDLLPIQSLLDARQNWET